MRKSIIFTVLLFVPSATFAAQTIQNLTFQLFDFATAIPRILTLLALIFFMYKVIMWIIADSTKKKDAAKDVGFGVIALFVMVSIWGLVSLLQSSLGIGTGGTLKGDTIPGVTGVKHNSSTNYFSR